MKVKNINTSSIKTDELIKQSFIELLYEKHDIQKITVTELCKRINITRSSFYTHYESIYDIAASFQDDATELLLNDSIKFDTSKDIYNYIDMITENVKENELTYKMLLSSGDQLFFFEKLKLKFIEKAINSNNEITKDKYFTLKINFFMDGIISQIIKYFKTDHPLYTIDELNTNIKEWFKQLFETK